MKKITKKDWEIFESSFPLKRSELHKIFPHQANFNEFKQLLLEFGSGNEFNNMFHEILWRFPISMTNIEFTRILQFFLMEEYHHDHEDIIVALQTEYNNDIGSISLLLKRVQILPNYYRNDDDLKYPLLRKIIYAIGAQPEPDNFIALEGLTSSDDEKVRELVLHQIEKRRKLGCWEFNK